MQDVGAGRRMTGPQPPSISPRARARSRTNLVGKSEHLTRLPCRSCSVVSSSTHAYVGWRAAFVPPRPSTNRRTPSEKSEWYVNVPALCHQLAWTPYRWTAVERCCQRPAARRAFFLLTIPAWLSTLATVIGVPASHARQVISTIYPCISRLDSNALSPS
ncbi:hypothetical protein HDK64DRAFT_259620 [Phyllosticta capitalensis]